MLLSYCLGLVLEMVCVKRKVKGKEEAVSYWVKLPLLRKQQWNDCGLSLHACLLKYTTQHSKCKCIQVHCL
jgi:hypothetical protein